MFSLLKPTFSLQHRPLKLTSKLHPMLNAPLPIFIFFFLLVNFIFCSVARSVALAHRSTEAPKHRSTEAPKHRSTEAPKHRSTEAPKRSFLSSLLRFAKKKRRSASYKFYLNSLNKKNKKSHSFGRLLSPGHCRRKNALPVSYYALFKKWLLLSKFPGCFSILTSFST